MLGDPNSFRDKLYFTESDVELFMSLQVTKFGLSREKFDVWARPKWSSFQDVTSFV